MCVCKRVRDNGVLVRNVDYCLSFSCPRDGQDVLTTDNTWRPMYSGSLSSLRTGLVALPRMKGSNAVFLVCTVKLCIHALAGQCAVVRYIVVVILVVMVVVVVGGIVV